MNADTVSGQISELSGHSSRAHRAEAEIVSAAHDRLQIVESEITELRPKTLGSREAAERYEDLIAERGHLQQVLGRARTPA